MQRRSSRASPRQGKHFSRKRKASSRTSLIDSGVRWGLQFPASGRSLRTQMGGGTARGNARSSRMFMAKKWMHVALRSEKAVGKLGFLLPKNSLLIEDVLREVAAKQHVQLADIFNLGGMLHFRVRAREQIHFQNFLRVVTTLIARRLTGAKKGNPFGRFWDGLCYSRILVTDQDQVGWLKAARKATRVMRETQCGSKLLLEQFSQWLKFSLRTHRGSREPCADP